MSENKKKRKLIAITIFLVSTLVGGLVGGAIGYSHSELTLKCSAVGDYDYIEFYYFEGNNGTVGNLAFRLTSYEQEIVYKPHYKYSLKTLQMEIFKDGSYNIGFIQIDIEQINVVNIHNVTVTTNLYFYGANSFDTLEGIKMPFWGMMFGAIGGVFIFLMLDIGRLTQHNNIDGF